MFIIGKLPFYIIEVEVRIVDPADEIGDVVHIYIAVAVKVEVAFIGYRIEVGEAADG